MLLGQGWKGLLCGRGEDWGKMRVAFIRFYHARAKTKGKSRKKGTGILWSKKKMLKNKEGKLLTTNFPLAVGDCGISGKERNSTYSGLKFSNFLMS